MVDENYNKLDCIQSSFNLQPTLHVPTKLDNRWQFPSRRWNFFVDKRFQKHHFLCQGRRKNRSLLFSSKLKMVFEVEKERDGIQLQERDHEYEMERHKCIAVGSSRISCFDTPPVFARRVILWKSFSHFIGRFSFSSIQLAPSPNVAPRHNLQWSAMLPPAFCPAKNSIPCTPISCLSEDI